MARSAFVTGFAGLSLSADERAFFREAQPAGVILFARNCESPDQVRILGHEIREACGTDDILVLIDQEGGRVQRLRPPYWTELPCAAAIGILYSRDADAGLEAARLAGRVIAEELASLSINTCCAPVLDLQFAGAHAVIGDRAFSTDPDAVAALGRAMATGLLSGGVLPVIKHIPGHGRARADSHHELPRVPTARAQLESTDFAPFKALADLPAAMTAHVLYEDIDATDPATTSMTIIQDVIRGQIGFGGLLISDDLSMKALAGNMAERTCRALAAGCDIALHCNGNLSEMQAVAAACGPLPDEARFRVAGCLALLGGYQAFDRPAAVAMLQSLQKFA